MARPRRPFSGMEEIRQHPVPWMSDETGTVLGVRQQRRWEASENWVYPTPNGCYDPLTYLFVLDQVMHIDPDIELRAKALTEWLSERGYGLTWDAVTVGKVLADLAEAFEDVLGEKMGLLERGRDWKGAFYRIHRNPETAMLAIPLREDLYRLAEEEMALRKAGKRGNLLASPLLECPSVRGEWKEV